MKKIDENNAGALNIDNASEDVPSLNSSGSSNLEQKTARSRPQKKRLHSSLSSASTAKRKKGHPQKDGIVTIEWPDSSDEEDDAESWESLDVPVMTPRKIFQDNSTVSSSGRRRRRFQDYEDEAIINGVNRHGFGNWKTILESSGGVLDDRSNMQIKDRARTLIKLGILEKHG